VPATATRADQRIYRIKGLSLGGLEENGDYGDDKEDDHEPDGDIEESLLHSPSAFVDPSLSPEDTPQSRSFTLEEDGHYKG
jgi:hypothetical protein